MEYTIVRDRVIRCVACRQVFDTELAKDASAWASGHNCEGVK